MADRSSPPRIRALALGVVALVVTAAAAVTGDLRVPVLLTVAGTLTVGGWWRWRHAGRTGLSTSALVAAVLVGVLLIEHLTDDVDLALQLTAAVTLVAGWVLQERRLVVSGLVTLAVLLGRPLPDGPTVQHCLLGPTVGLPVLRLDGLLVLALVATAAGTTMRWAGWRLPVARGAEATGAVGLTMVLLAKAAELQGHRWLCGPGGSHAIDEGWLLAGMAFGVVAGLYGLAARDTVWEAAGLASIASQGLLATTLTGAWWWAAGAAVVLGAGLAVAEWVGVPWHDQPSWSEPRPRFADLKARAARRRPGGRESR